ncbi:CBS domain-containing protein [Haloarcula sp. NS06]|uniref:CBS domain-containing protein n=1 Tax=unclassified Haloarcula TaxID=2624677 RepID=UPI0027B85808|nr:CBS domain-containing protein [Haloarcula sp. H-GB4]MDQ2073839.1 CBS domain-containing protein [Haloarcula sp. H-GB4]
MNVADAMTPRSEVVTVTIPGTRDDALEYLQEQAFSSVPVIKETDDGEEFRGIISRDALIESPDEDQLAILVEEVPTISGDTSIEAAAQMMVEDGERRLPIVDGQLKGIITVTDVIRSIANGDVDGGEIVDELANRDINCVYEGTPLTVAERELSHANVPYGIVLGDDGDMSGMLTEVDIIAVARVVEGEDDTGDSIANQDDDWAWEGIKAVGGRYMPTRNVELPAEPVREFMTADVVTVNKRRTAEEAAQLMIEHDIEQIPLLSGDELTGIVRDIDLLRGL